MNDFIIAIPLTRQVIAGVDVFSRLLKLRGAEVVLRLRDAILSRHNL